MKGTELSPKSVDAALDVLQNSQTCNTVTLCCLMRTLWVNLADEDIAQSPEHTEGLKIDSGILAAATRDNGQDLNEGDKLRLTYYGGRLIKIKVSEYKSPVGVGVGVSGRAQPCRRIPDLSFQSSKHSQKRHVYWHHRGSPC